MASTDVSTTVHPLAVVSDVAVRLASGDDVVTKTSDILELLKSAFGGQEVGLWLYGATGLVC